jgi:hypothetical protein
MLLTAEFKIFGKGLSETRSPVSNLRISFKFHLKNGHLCKLPAALKSVEAQPFL